MVPLSPRRHTDETSPRRSTHARYRSPPVGPDQWRPWAGNHLIAGCCLWASSSMAQSSSRLSRARASFGVGGRPDVGRQRPIQLDRPSAELLEPGITTSATVTWLASGTGAGGRSQPSSWATSPRRNLRTPSHIPAQRGDGGNAVAVGNLTNEIEVEVLLGPVVVLRAARARCRCNRQKNVCRLGSRRQARRPRRRAVRIGRTLAWSSPSTNDSWKSKNGPTTKPRCKAFGGDIRIAYEEQNGAVADFVGTGGGTDPRN